MRSSPLLCALVLALAPAAGATSLPAVPAPDPALQAPARPEVTPRSLLVAHWVERARAEARRDPAATPATPDTDPLRIGLATHTAEVLPQPLVAAGLDTRGSNPFADLYLRPVSAP